MIKTAIIGASGYIGHHLFNAYRNAFPDCIGTFFSRGGPGLVPFDLCQSNIAPLKLKETGHQAVIITSAKPNVAWCESHPDEAYQLNVKGTLTLVKQLAAASLTTYFLSSDYVFDGRLGHYEDSSLPTPITVYGQQKAEVEREIPNITDNYAIIRLSKIYGTVWQDGTLIDGMAKDLVQKRSITVADDQFFSPTHIDDVVSMILYCQEKNTRGMVHLCHSTPHSRYQIAEKLALRLGAPSHLLIKKPLHTIVGMERRPLNTSLQCSAFLNNKAPAHISIEQAIEQVAANWAGKSRQ